MRRLYYETRRISLIIFVLFFSPFIFLLIRRKRSDLKGSPRSDLRILLMPHLTRIGDLVCATPIFAAIKQKYPESHLAVLIAGRLEPLLKNHPHVDEIIIYRHYDFWGTIKKIREKEFNWSFSLSGTAVSSVIAFLGFIPNRVKITRRPRPVSEFLTDWLSGYQVRYEHHKFLLDYDLKLLEFIGIKNPSSRKVLGLCQNGEVRADKYFKENNLSTDGFIVGISIGAGNKIKEWGDDKFKELAERLIERYKAKIILIGSKSQEARIKRIFGKNIFYATDYALGDLPSLIKRLKLFISVDTGPIYIAHAVGTPLIDIIGPVDPNEQPPNDERSIQVLPPLHIKPTSFVFKKPGKPEEHKKAIESISVEDVFAAVDKLFN